MIDKHAIGMAMLPSGADPNPGETEEGGDSAGAKEIPSASSRGRGDIVPLSLSQIRNRALYLAGEIPLSALDGYVDKTFDLRTHCVPIYYRLSDNNGGKNPRAIDPATRWSKPGSTFVNVTSDCMGAAAWCGGFDRYQQQRFSHIYEGWINTDSMIQDATTSRKCFIECEVQPGCFIVVPSANGRKGHIGIVVEVGHSATTHGVIDIADRGSGVRANKRTTSNGFASRGARFIRSIMKP